MEKLRRETDESWSGGCAWPKHKPGKIYKATDTKVFAECETCRELFCMSPQDARHRKLLEGKS